MTVSVQLRVTKAQRKALDDAAEAKRKRTGSKDSRASMLALGAAWVCAAEGVVWPTDTQGPT
jgi:hypothetical protein